jgi:hypothetical protein
MKAISETAFRKRTLSIMRLSIRTSLILLSIRTVSTTRQSIMTFVTMTLSILTLSNSDT